MGIRGNTGEYGGIRGNTREYGGLRGNANIVQWTSKPLQALQGGAQQHTSHLHANHPGQTSTLFAPTFWPPLKPT